jgi:hypothetical protein
MDGTVMSARVTPWRKPALTDCYFYHAMDFPGGTVSGDWDLRGRFQEYIGGVDVRGKTVFDMGTATGFLAFSAEKAGASGVVAYEMDDISRSPRIPFRDNLAFINKSEWASSCADGLTRQKNGFWYLWHSLQSRVEAYYGSIETLLSFPETFDIVLAGAIMEHLSDPVTAIGAACRLAREKVVIAFTPVLDTDEELMRPLLPWTDPQIDYVWWALSRGLYRRVLGNMGFRMEIAPCNITRGGSVVTRDTIIAIRE